MSNEYDKSTIAISTATMSLCWTQGKVCNYFMGSANYTLGWENDDLFIWRSLPTKKPIRGTGDRIPPQLQLPVAQAFFAGHRKRQEPRHQAVVAIFSSRATQGLIISMEVFRSCLLILSTYKYSILVYLNCHSECAFLGPAKLFRPATPDSASKMMRSQLDCHGLDSGLAKLLVWHIFASGSCIYLTEGSRNCCAHL